jgi:hypothetical protein
MGQTFPINELSIAVGATVNILAGSSIQFQTVASVLTIYGNSDAVGLTHAFFLNNGSLTIAIIPPGSGLGVASTVGKIKTNEDFVIQYAIPAGQALVHQVTNPTAGIVKVNFMYVLT